jgi:hypothetical protein
MEFQGGEKSLFYSKKQIILNGRKMSTLNANWVADINTSPN